MGNLIYTKEATAPLKLCSDFYEAECARTGGINSTLSK